MGKAARFTQSTGTVCRIPNEWRFPVGEASARRSRWKKRTPVGRGHSPATRLFQSERFSSSTAGRKRALPNLIASLQLSAVVWLFFQGMPHHLATTATFATSSDYRSRPEPWSQGNSTNARLSFTPKPKSLLPTQYLDIEGKAVGSLSLKNSPRGWPAEIPEPHCVSRISVPASSAPAH